MQAADDRLHLCTPLFEVLDEIVGERKDVYEDVGGPALALVIKEPDPL
jgi:hypothetical protein